ncbi:MAG: hypothetical protein JNN07_26635 [Verrucomicrobiales bacterium]|nr:hypothetical protein [Verrucomicrobiales bacterium]
MNTRQHNSRSRSLTKAGWWGRVLIAALFAFYLHYIPLHLATAAHLDGFLESVAHAVSHQDGHDDADHHDDNDHHTPHPSSDHTLTLTAQTQSPVSVLAVVCVLADTSILIELSQPQRPIPVFERIRPPGDSPPDPLHPRAPPLA